MERRAVAILSGHLQRQLERIKPFFPKSRGVGRVDDRKVLSGITYMLHHGLRRVDAPVAYGPCKPLSPLTFMGERACYGEG